MAVRAGTQIRQPNGVVTIAWAGLLEVGSVRDTGSPVALPLLEGIFVQAIGNFDTSAVVTLQGSNDGGTTWATIGSGTLTAANPARTISERPALVRPAITVDGAGDATNLTVILSGTAKRS